MARRSGRDDSIRTGGHAGEPYQRRPVVLAARALRVRSRFALQRDLMDLARIALDHDPGDHVAAGARRRQRVERLEHLEMPRRLGIGEVEGTRAAGGLRGQCPVVLPGEDEIQPSRLDPTADVDYQFLGKGALEGSLDCEDTSLVVAAPWPRLR